MVETTQTGGLWPSLYEPFRNLGNRLSNWVTPASDASTDEDAYRITLELPGVEEGDIDLTLEDSTLTVTGEKTAEREEKGDTWFFSERQYGSFRRSFRMPGDADLEQVEADLKDGVLTITVPRRVEPEKAARKVAVKKTG